MSAYPLMLFGEAIRALVVGGGSVAARKIRGLLEVGADVRVVAPELGEDIFGDHTAGKFRWRRAAYASRDIGDANIVFAATNSSEVNSRVVADARALGRLVNNASDAATGDFAAVASHRQGELTLAIYAGGVPAAAAAVRHELGAQIGPDHGEAVAQLAALRREMLEVGDRAAWMAASAELVPDDFLAFVSAGEFAKRLARWR